MNDQKKERRRFERAFFSKDDGIKGIFLPPGIGEKPDPIIANIMNLGAGGLHFIYKKKDAGEINTEDRLILEEIKGSEALNFCTDIEIKVKWILKAPFLDHIGVGCEFLNLSGAIKSQIDQFVNAEIERRFPKEES